MFVYAHEVQRLVVLERRSLRLEWLKGKQAYDLRLVRGHVLLTPPCLLTPLDMYGLANGHVGGLDGWFKIRRYNVGSMSIMPLRDLRDVKKDLADWPDVSWNQFYDLASIERGLPPEEGWHKLVEQMNGL